MSNKRVPRVYEPPGGEWPLATGVVHYKAPPGIDQWSLCGGTDRIGEPPVEPTDEPCTCWFCIQIAEFCCGGGGEAEL